MTHDSDLDESSSGDDDPSQDGKIPQPDPACHMKVFRLRFSLKDFVTERGEDPISATIDFTWLEFPELFKIAQNGLQQVTLGTRTVSCDR
jgi:hypothetical protein